LSIVAEETEDLIVSKVLNRDDTRTLRARSDYKRIGARASAAGAEVLQHESRLRELAAMYGRHQITEAEWMEARSTIMEGLEEVRGQITDDSRVIVLAPYAAKGLLQARWPKLDIDERRKILGAVLDHAVVHPATRGGRFTEDRIGFVWREE
jgi:hypothetical protein